MKKVEKSEELKKLAEKLRKIFIGVEKKLKGKELTDRTLDREVLSILKKFEISRDNIEIRFSEPKDNIYRAEAGRTPYDLLSYGKINGKKFLIFINNKFGDLYSNARNDITTYNNLLRLYLGIKKQRLTSKITIDEDLIYNRVSGNEIVSYAVFVMDNKRHGSKFFLLEEIKDYFYVNPRNTMFQIEYNPSLREPTDYYSFVTALIDAVLESLQKSVNAIETEIIVLGNIKTQLIRIKEGLQNE